MTKNKTRQRTKSKSIFSNWKNKISLLLIVIISSGTMYYTSLPGDQLYTSTITIDPNSATLTTDIFYSLRDQYSSILDIKLQKIRAKKKLDRSCDPGLKLVRSARTNLEGMSDFPPALQELLLQEKNNKQYDLQFEKYESDQLKTVRKYLIEFLEEPKNIINLKFNEYQILLKYLKITTKRRIVSSDTPDTTNDEPEMALSSQNINLVNEIIKEMRDSKIALDLSFEFIKKENKAAMTIAGLCKTGKKLHRIMKKVSTLRKITESTIKKCFGLHSRNSRCVYKD